MARTFANDGLELVPETVDAIFPAWPRRANKFAPSSVKFFVATPEECIQVPLSIRTTRILTGRVAMLGALVFFWTFRLNFSCVELPK